ncbi:hypothetical protein GCM10018965_067210 [Nonomuraea roseola]
MPITYYELLVLLSGAPERTARMSPVERAKGRASPGCAALRETATVSGSRRSRSTNRPPAPA